MATTRTPKPEDVRKAVHTAFDQVRTSLLAALGAGSLAGQAVAEAVDKAKERSETARKGIEELPSEVEGLREKLDPAELRKLLDEYTDAALKLYHKLAESGEETWERFAAQAQVKKSFEQFEEALQTAQGHLDEYASEARGRLDEVVSRVTGKPREASEKAAPKAESAEQVESRSSSKPGSAKVEQGATATPKPKSTATARKTTTAAKKTTTSTTSTTAARKASDGTPKNPK